VNGWRKIVGAALVQQIGKIHESVQRVKKPAMIGGPDPEQLA
jgi:hypothetical protein